jgi:hypothetical protein
MLVIGGEENIGAMMNLYHTYDNSNKNRRGRNNQRQSAYETPLCPLVKNRIIPLENTKHVNSL